MYFLIQILFTLKFQKMMLSPPTQHPQFLIAFLRVCRTQKYKNMKSLLFLTFVFLFTSIKLFGQCTSPNCTGVNSINISTGIDPSGNFLPLGSIDPFWHLVNYPPLNLFDGDLNLLPDCWPDYNNDGVQDPPNVIIPNARVVSLLEYPTSTTSPWLNLNGCTSFNNPCGVISSHPVNKFSCNNLITNQPWRFRRYFCVCKQSNLNITGNIRIDDIGRFRIYDINNVQLLDIPVGGSIYSNTSLNSTLNLNTGTYYIEVEMLNTAGSLMGFVINGSITTSTGQNNLISSNSACCSNIGNINVQKVLETKNCNGIMESGESFGVGWTFTLLNSSGAIIQTQITNSFGELTFSGLVPGTYTVVEQTQLGYSTTTPSQQVTLNATANGSTNLVFYNCPIPIEPEKTCCPESKNLVTNGGFGVSTGFTSNYTLQSAISLSSILPGQYNVLNQTQAATVSPSTWLLQDHGTCSAGGKFLIVNGKTGQAGSATIWGQTIATVTRDTQYRFCAYVKNLPQCAFDVKPLISVWINGVQYLAPVTISTSALVCDWQLVSFNFTATSNSPTVEIKLDQTPLGDGNDLAIDDISITKLASNPISLAMFQITSEDIINTTDNFYQILATPDYPLSKGCKYYWYVCEINPITKSCIGSMMIGGSMGTLTWALGSTNFPGYCCTNGLTSPAGNFKYGTEYRITRIIDCDCKKPMECTKTFNFFKPTAKSKSTQSNIKLTDVEIRDILKIIENQK